MANSGLTRTVLVLAIIALVFYIGEQIFRLGDKLGNIVSILAGAWFLSVLARPVVSWLSNGLVPRVLLNRMTPGAKSIAARVRLPFGLAVAVSYVTLLIAVFGFITLGVTSIVPQISDLVNRAPDIYAQLPAQINLVWGSIAPRLNLDPRAINQLLVSDSVTGQIQSAAAFVAGQTLRIATGTATFFGQLFLALVLSLYITTDGKTLVRDLFRLLPQSAHATANASIGAVGHAFDGYLRGAVLASAIEAFNATVWLSVFRVNFALALGVMYFVLALIPLVGAPVSISTILLVTLLFQPAVLLPMAIILVAATIVNAYIITPRLMRDAVGVPGLLGLLSTSLSTALFGFWGLLFGVPVVGAIYALVFRFRGLHANSARTVAPVVDVDPEAPQAAAKSTAKSA